MDSIERIKADVLKTSIAYFHCEHIDCDNCPMRRFYRGQSPKQYYKVDTCSKAVDMDIAARLRFLVKSGSAKDKHRLFSAERKSNGEK